MSADQSERRKPITIEAIGVCRTLVIEALVISVRIRTDLALQIFSRVQPWMIGLCPLLRRRTRLTEVRSLLFLSCQKFPRNRRFLDSSSKTGSDRAYCLGLNVMCPSSIQWYMGQSDRTSGFGRTSRSVFLRRRTRLTEVRSLLILSGQNSHGIEGFWTISPKPEVIERHTLGVKWYVPHLYPMVYELQR